MASTARLFGIRHRILATQIEALLNCRSYTLGINIPQLRHSIPAVTVSGLDVLEQTPLSLFRQLEPNRSQHDDYKLLRPVSKASLGFVNGYPKTFFFNRKTNKSKKRKKRVPKLILLQNPLTWLMIKFDFSVLRSIWDPTFVEKEFKFGTKQAISRVTQVISDGQYAELNGLLTKAARMSLLRELERNWSDRQRVLLTLHRDDIQISSPRKVYFIRIAGHYPTRKFGHLMGKIDSPNFVVWNKVKDAQHLLVECILNERESESLMLKYKTSKFNVGGLTGGILSEPNLAEAKALYDKKFCDVDMAFLALKWIPINSIDTLIFTEIFARFHREYTPHCIPEWTIAYFKVTRFEVLRRQE